MRILLENFTKRFGNVTVIENMNLEVRDGEMLALLGPSGCGKSTTLLAICGILAVDGGCVRFDDEDVSNKPPQQRNIGVVFQSYALYPHMNVFKNIAFPLEIRGDDTASIERAVREVAQMLHIDELMDRLPAHLSGGEQQRVALARALVRRPSVLLLDEPLANLDARLRLEMRSEIRRLQTETGITAILVTHDQVEAMSMCDRIAVMDRGEIHQVATPAEMYGNPISTFVAGFLGIPPIAFLRGSAVNGRFVLPGSEIVIDLPADTANLGDGLEVQLGIRPELLSLTPDGPIIGKIGFVETQGRENLYDIILPDGSVLRSIQPVRNDIKLGDEVRWSVDTSKILVFDGDGTRL